MHTARLRGEPTFEGAAAPKAVGSRRVLRLALLEMAGFILCRRAPAEWFEHYLKRFDTVEINASFYSWPTVANVQAWRRAPGKKKFVYTVKVCELITHIKKFKGTKTLIKDFGMIADILGDRMGCFLFQLPPSYRYTKARLKDIVSQLDPRGATSSNSGTPAGGTKRSTAPFARQE